MSYDPETGEITPTEGAPAGDCSMCAGMRGALEAATKDVKGLERDLRSSRRKVTSLEEEMREQRMESPEGAVIRTIFRYWIKKTGRNEKTAKLGDKRSKVVQARLREGRSPEYIMRAIDGAAAAPAVSSQESERLALVKALQAACERLPDEEAATVRAVYARERQGVTKYDDLELICRDEVHLERAFEKGVRLFGPLVTSVNAPDSA